MTNDRVHVRRCAGTRDEGGHPEAQGNVEEPFLSTDRPFAERLPKPFSHLVRSRHITSRKNNEEFLETLSEAL